MNQFGPPQDDDDLQLEAEPVTYQQGTTGGPVKQTTAPPDLELDRPAERDEAPPERPRLRLKVLLLALGLLGLVGWEATATLIQHSAAPTPADWRAAVERVKQERKREEPVLIAPAWAEPLGRMHLGDQLSLEQHLLPDVDRFGRVWELSVRGRRHRWLESLRPAKQWELGGVTLSMFEKPPKKVSFDFTGRILEARVDRQGSRAAQCKKRGRRFVCDPRQGWNWVGPRLAEVNYEPHRCIHAHPVDGHVLRITFPAVALGRELVGYTGIDDYDNRKRGNKPVTLRVYVGPRLIGTIVHQNRWGWRRFNLSSAAMRGQTHPVRFEITAEGAYARTFCFAAEARD
jgi:hypothetical protein